MNKCQQMGLAIARFVSTLLLDDALNVWHRLENSRKCSRAVIASTFKGLVCPGFQLKHFVLIKLIMADYKSSCNTSAPASTSSLKRPHEFNRIRESVCVIEFLLPSHYHCEMASLPGLVNCTVLLATFLFHSSHTAFLDLP